MTLRPYKFLVQAIVQNVNDEGDVLGEATVGEAIVFGTAALAVWAEEFADKLAQAEADA